MTAEPQRRLSADDYLALERASETRSEYLDGEVFAMAGASREHNLIATNVVGTLHPQLKARGCEKYASDMRVRIAATGLYTYPDVVVVGGQPRFEDEERDTLLNPTLIVEVLSPSTEDYDRGRRFAHYRSIPSLQVYLLVRQDRAHVELFTRQRDDRWVLWETDDLGATVDLSAIGATIALADVYDRVPGVSI